MPSAGPRHVCVTIEYDGTRFNGWQVQAGDKRTVQAEIEKALYTIFKKRIRIAGSGRTDSGVHAAGQTASFSIPDGMPLDEVLRALNGNLPQDIVILSIREVAANFHARFSVKRKRYTYSIINRPVRPVLGRQQFVFLDQRLNLRRMRQEAQVLVGRHDFRSFASSDRTQKDKNTVRTLYDITIKKRGETVTIELEADGFLYKMVRNIVGSLLAVGSGRLPRGAIKGVLAKKDRQAASQTAPARGLCLSKVTY